MFFCPELLLKRGHPFFVVWIAATQKGDRLNRYLTPRKVAKLNIYHVIENVLRRVVVTSSIPRQLATHNGCFSLYLSAQLMFGCCVALNRKATILINDLGRISKNLRRMRFSSEKSQMVLQFPKKSGRKGSSNVKHPSVLAGRQLSDGPHDFRSILETISGGNILEITLDDGGEEVPLEYTHSVPEQTITLKEFQFSPSNEDTRFGDEGDGGRGFIDFLNGQSADTMLVESVEDLQIDNIRTSSHITRRISGPHIDESASAVPPELEQLGISDRICEDHSGEIAPYTLPFLPYQDDNAGRLSEACAEDNIHIQPTLFQRDSDMEGIPLGVTAGHLDEIASVVPLDLELQPAPPELEHHAIDESASAVPPELEQPGISDRICEDHSGEIAPNILPLPDQNNNAGRLSEACVDENIHIQPTLFQGDGDMELPELDKTPETGRKRKKRTNLTIDERTTIPASVIRRRIDDKARDTLRKEDSYENCMSMLIKAKWLNLEQMRLPGQIQLSQSRPLATLFSRHLVTRPDPCDDDDFDLDQSLNQPGRRESPHDTPQASFPVTSSPSLLEGRKQSENIDTLILSPSETLIHRISSPQGEKLDFMNEPSIFDSPLTGKEEERRQITPNDHTVKPESMKRSRQKLQSSDHLILPSPKRRSITQTVKEVSANKEAAALETIKSVEGFQDQETSLRDEVDDFTQYSHDAMNLAESLPDQGTGMKLEADARAQDIPDPIGITINSMDTLQGLENSIRDEADIRAQDISGLIESSNLTEILLGQETVTVLNSEEGTNGFIENLPDHIQSKGVEDPNGGRRTRPKRPRQESGVGVERDSVSDSSSSSLGPNVLQNVLDSACELARERNETTIPIAVLCPPSTRRRQAAGFFGALLDLHKKKQVTLHQDKDELTAGPISITVNELS